MNDMSNAPRIWAHKGSQITCTQGHPICEIARDVYVGEPRSGADFTAWQQTEPDRSTSVADIQCTVCGGSWINGGTDSGYRFHFEDGWR